MTRFAEKTDVPAERSRGEIETLLRRYGATGFLSGWSGGRAHVAFEMSGRRLKFVMKVPEPTEKRFTIYRRGTTDVARSPDAAFRLWEQAGRQIWRALLLVIKAKLEAVEAGISVFDDEFLAQIVMPDGRTVAEHVREPVALAYKSGTMAPLLPDYSERKP
jgi:hypothetical protein